MSHENLQRFVIIFYVSWEPSETFEYLWCHIRTFRDLWVFVTSQENLHRLVNICDVTWVPSETCEYLWCQMRTFRDLWLFVMSHDYLQRLWVFVMSHDNFHRLVSICGVTWEPNRISKMFPSPHSQVILWLTSIYKAL